METTEASELVEHVNEGCGRFKAALLNIGATRAWVLVEDRHTPGRGGNPHFLEPISDFRTYLQRARRERALFPEEYVTLLEGWDAGRHAVA